MQGESGATTNGPNENPMKVALAARRMVVSSTAGRPSPNAPARTPGKPRLVINAPYKIPPGQAGWTQVRAKAPPANARRVESAFTVRHGTDEVAGSPGDWVLVDSEGEVTILNDRAFRENFEPASSSSPAGAYGPWVRNEIGDRVSVPTVADPLALVPVSRSEAVAAISQAVEKLKKVAELVGRIPEAPKPKQFGVCPICGAVLELSSSGKEILDHLKATHPIPKIPKGAML